MINRPLGITVPESHDRIATFRPDSGRDRHTGEPMDHCRNKILARRKQSNARPENLNYESTEDICRMTAQNNKCLKPTIALLCPKLKTQNASHFSGQTPVSQRFHLRSQAVPVDLLGLSNLSTPLGRYCRSLWLLMHELCISQA